mmetsp:Transcript_36867/g.92410  ORF Transcript_36867/g.92410 Transcript_36867/m.92410 type:complete len:87 (+) Transcript_36867:1133-1393(+)
MHGTIYSRQTDRAAPQLTVRALSGHKPSEVVLKSATLGGTVFGRPIAHLDENSLVESGSLTEDRSDHSIKLGHQLHRCNRKSSYDG